MKDKKNYKCDACKKAFSKSDHLRKHIESLHIKLRNHKCDENR